MPESDPHRVFLDRLHAVRTASSFSTEAQLAKAMGYARSTVSSNLGGRNFPSWDWTRAFLIACGCDPEQWREEWVSAKTVVDQRKRALKRGDDSLRHTAVPVPVAGEALLAARWYESNPLFYQAATVAAEQATKEIRVTYLRRYPPNHYTTPASVRYFEAVLEWAATPTEDERSVRRIIGVPEQKGVPDREIVSWARRHHEQTKGILNYEAAVLRGSAPADGMNLALFDSTTAFLAFSGGARQKLNGFSVSDSAFMGYFAAYFDQLWTSLPSLGAYLEQLDG